jgi:hypothetical protein
MADFAAHHRDHVMPHVPVRQWVLTVPFRLRFGMAFDPRSPASQAESPGTRSVCAAAAKVIRDYSYWVLAPLLKRTALSI